jgi:hypothetical protein
MYKRSQLLPRWAASAAPANQTKTLSKVERVNFNIRSHLLHALYNNTLFFDYTVN